MYYALTLIVLSPVIAEFLFRRERLAFFISAPLGVLVLCGHMVISEANAADSDFDIFFGIGCLFWAAVLMSAYASFFLLISLLRKTMKL